MTESDYYQYQKKYASLAEKVSNYARKHMFETFIKALRPDQNTSVIDVGVTCDKRSDSNFFEKIYPYPQNITAVGLEDASFLEQDFPGLKFIKVEESKLPFGDKQFELGVSWAVIEHVGSREKQKAFLSEILRVSKRVFITTPNRWYPIEFHTVTAFLHWLPPELFRKILKTFKMDFYASEDTLNLLSENDLLEMLPKDARVQKLHFRLLGPISHLILYIES